MQIHFQNSYLKATITLEPFFSITEFIDLHSGKNIFTSEPDTRVADRGVLPEAKFLGQKQDGNSYKLQWQFGGVILTRHLFFYENAPAIRWYDVYSSTSDFSGMYYSTLAKFKLLTGVDHAKVINWFTCSDQSNHRELSAVATNGKNRGAYFLTDDIFLYKEGPMPDSQPIKGECDFLFSQSDASIEMLGLGFDNLRPGELRRANGVVIGLARDFGLQRYNLERYAAFPRMRESTSVLCNSWPELEHGISEESITKEVHAAAESGVNVVFIDDGWFDPYMGPIDEKKFPNRFDELKKIASGYGIEIGLWVNPLCIDVTDPHMTLWSGFDNHDLVTEDAEFNWLARTSDYNYCNLSSPNGICYTPGELMDDGFFQHMKNYLADLYRNYGVRHFKFDCYQMSHLNTRLGDEHLHYEKYRELCDALMAEIPDLVVSFDVTRSNRPNFNFALDYGRLFLENRGRGIPDHRYYHPYMALGNTWYTMKYVHGLQMETEIMPQAEDYDLEYILGTTIFSTPLYWGCVAKLSPERRVQMKAFYEKVAPARKKIAGYIHLPLGEMAQKGNWCAIAAISPDCKDGYVAVYRNGSSEKTYTVTLPFGNSLTPVFGAGDGSLQNGSLTVTHEKEFSCSFYQFQ